MAEGLEAGRVDKEEVALDCSFVYLDGTFHVHFKDGDLPFLLYTLQLCIGGSV